MNLILANSNVETTHASRRPIKIIILFEENLNACSAEVFIKHLTSNYPCGTKPFSIEESGSSGPAAAAGRSASDAIKKLT
jgi:hypothetical protein